MPRGKLDKEPVRIFTASVHFVRTDTCDRPSRKRPRAASKNPALNVPPRRYSNRNAGREAPPRDSSPLRESSPAAAIHTLDEQQRFSSPNTLPAFHTAVAAGYSDYLHRLQLDLQRRCSVVAENSRNALCVAIATADVGPAGLTIQVKLGLLVQKLSTHKLLERCISDNK